MFPTRKANMSGNRRKRVNQELMKLTQIIQRKLKSHNM